MSRVRAIRAVRSPRYKRKSTIRELNGLVDEMVNAVEKLDSYLAQGLGQDLEARLARLGRSGGAVDLMKTLERIIESEILAVGVNPPHLTLPATPAPACRPVQGHHATHRCRFNSDPRRPVHNSDSLRIGNTGFGAPEQEPSATAG